MKKTIYILLVSALMLAAFSLAVQAQDVSKLKFPKLNEIQVPEIEKVTLDNGMRLYLLEDKSLPIFRVNVRLNCGSYLEPADKVGLADFCGAVMRTGGTAKWTGDEIDEMLEGVGGSVETNIGLDMGSARVNVLSEYTDLGLEVLAEVLRRPVFDEDKIELAKVQERSNISRRNDDIATLARREYRKLIYGPESPYARHTEYATVNAITRDDLAAFHKQYLKPENVQMAVWGDFDKDELLAKINQYFGDWQRGDTPVPPLPEVNYEWRSKVYYIEKTDVEQAYIRLGHIGGMVTDDDYTDRIVMNSVLGEGFGSRITDNVRTRLGLAYSTGGRYISEFGYPGYFFALASTKPESVILASKEMITQIKSMLTDPPTEDEMKKGKDGYLNSFVFNFDSKGEVLGRMMTYDFYGLPENFLQLEKEGVEKVTPEAVMAAAKKNLRPDEMVILVVGNEAKFDEPLASLGLPIDTIDITIPKPVEEKELVVNEETLAKGKELLQLVAEAQGGVANFKNVETVHIKGTFAIATPQGEIPLPFEDYRGIPDRSYSLVTFMGRKMYDITNGDTGWRSDQGGAIVEKTAEEITEGKEDDDRNLILIFRQCDNPSYQAVYDGSEEIDGQKIEYVALLKENGDKICRLAAYADSHRLYSLSYWGKTIMGEGNIENIFSEFKDASGIVMPMNILRNMDGQKVGQLTYSEFTVNGDVPAGIFEKPVE